MICFMVSWASLMNASPRGRHVSGFNGPDLIHSGQPEEIRQQGVTVLRRDALGVKLNAVDWQIFVRDAHHHPVVGFRRHAQAGGHGGAIDCQGVIARSLELRRQAREHAGTVVPYDAELSVHDLGSSNDASAERLANGLVAQTHPENGNRARGFLDELETDSRAVRIAGSRREDDSCRPKGEDVARGHRVVAEDARVRAQLTQEMDEVVSKAVVVVDYDEHFD